ncbi:Arp10p LALA0_S07e06546g [Lachancea lanzarotensis]|uniref:LALA0S07e06546g1_1 n=1 Tax=Lachancea lanzarotensis TaxID=1245769 RepID=A0A0C7N9Q1_9SACH|nr:uncharacterized protein LALA0_S07e06546g [Lachancea lanzarotensis]CEP63280.1 LALA0S07e06546g1_1 [Lachancea lanzarotensis]
MIERAQKGTTLAGNLRYESFYAPATQCRSSRARDFLRTQLGIPWCKPVGKCRFREDRFAALCCERLIYYAHLSSEKNNFYYEIEELTLYPCESVARTNNVMSSSYVVVQLGSRVIRIGHCGDPEPLLTYFWPIDQAYNERLTTRLFRQWVQDPLMVDCRKTHVLVVENVLLPVETKKMMARIFQELCIAEVIFIPDALMCLVAAGLRNGLVIDVGWEHLLAIPVADLRILDCGLEISTKGGHWLARQISSVIRTEPSDLDEIVETVLSKTSKLSIEVRSVQKKLIEELIGQDNASDFDSDEFPIFELVSCSHDSLPIDVRKSIKKHVVMSGLASRVPSLRAHCEMLLQDFCFLDTLGPWIGGSLYFEQLLRISTERDCELSELVPNDWHAQRFKVYK